MDRAISFLSSLRIEQAEAELQTAMDQATVDDFRWLERLVIAERSLSSALLTGDSHERNNKGGVEAVRVGPSALLRAAARLSYLRATKEKQILSLERLQAAIQVLLFVIFKFHPLTCRLDYTVACSSPRTHCSIFLSSP